MTVSSEKGLLVGPTQKSDGAAGPRGRSTAAIRPGPAPGRGRPVLMSRDAVLERIRRLAGREEGIFRVHLTHSGLYARARRMFGSWAAAVEAAGVDYRRTQERARWRALRTRKTRAAKRRTAQET